MAEDSETYFEIEFLSGPSDGEIVPIATTAAVLGRESGVDVPIVSDTVVSRRHAQIRWSAGRIQIEDLGSSYGTFVNGERVGSARLLRNTDIITMGHTELVCRSPQASDPDVEQRERAAEADSNR